MVESHTGLMQLLQNKDEEETGRSETGRSEQTAEATRAGEEDPKSEEAVGTDSRLCKTMHRVLTEFATYEEARAMDVVENGASYCGAKKMAAASNAIVREAIATALKLSRRIAEVGDSHE